MRPTEIFALGRLVRGHQSLSMPPVLSCQSLDGKRGAERKRECGGEGSAELESGKSRSWHAKADKAAAFGIPLASFLCNHIKLQFSLPYREDFFQESTWAIFTLLCYCPKKNIRCLVSINVQEEGDR